MSEGMAAVAPAVSAAVEQALALFEQRPPAASVALRDGYVDLLGEDDDPTGGHLVQRLMTSRLIPRIYERVWRPMAMRVLAGRKGPRRLEECRIAVGMLALSAGDSVLDVGCGPGNFTRSFAEATGDGLVVGFDASKTMLAAGARATANANVAYVRGDACALPFKASSFDAVCCFGALHLFEPPLQALDEIVRVLGPGGRVALMTTCDPDSAPGGDAIAVRKHGGMLMFARDQVTAALGERGLLEIEQRVTGSIQFISARKPIG